MVFKMMACWRLAKKYNLARWDIMLPTGCDCILEQVFSAEHVEDNGCPIELVHRDLRYLLWLAVPVAGLIAAVSRVIWRYHVLYRYLAPTLHPEMSDWERLMYVIVPSVYYFRIWRDIGDSSIR